VPTQILAAVANGRGRPGRNSPLGLLVLAIVSTAAAAGGLACLWIHAGATIAEQVLAPAGIVLIATSLVQLRVISSAWRRNRIVAAYLAPGRFSRAMAAGVVVAYLVVVAMGPAVFAIAVLVAAISVWYTILLLPLAGLPHALEAWRNWVRRPIARRAVWAVQAALGLLVIGEAALEASRFLLAPSISSAAIPSRIAGAEADRDARLPDELDLRFAKLSSGRFRVAVVGDATSIASYGSQRYAGRLQHVLPGLELVPLAIAQPWSLGPSSDLNERVLAASPELVLAVVSSCENLTHERGAASWFDWRQWELARLVTGKEPAPRDVFERPVAQSAGDDFEAFLRQVSPELIACRTPIEAATAARWQGTFAALDQLAASCRARQIPLSLVILPGRYQVDHGLFKTLVRRAGATVDQFDLDLPQRSLAAFAERRHIPVLDLLPPFRIDGQKLYERNATTWNEHGNLALTATIGSWLESSYGGQLALAAQSIGR
jgi:hypothetical protein